MTVTIRHAVDIQIVRLDSVTGEDGLDFGAGNGDRTRGLKLGKLALYQLSYARLKVIIKESVL